MIKSGVVHIYDVFVFPFHKLVSKTCK